MQIRSDILRDYIELLRQGGRVVVDIPDDVFAATTPISPHGTIGAHFRHVLDFYEQFLSGLGEFRVDYNKRNRDSSLERNRYHTLARLEKTINRLERLKLTDLSHQHLLVSVENSASYSRSSVLRELDFLSSHTVHHYSLIAMLLRLYELNPGEEFGVAPSTLAHRKQELACAQ